MPALLRRVPAAAVCALAAHTVLYRTLWPSDGVHGYFGWYEPAVAALSVAALVGLAALLVAAALGRPVILPTRRRPEPLAAGVRAIGASSLCFLLIQESIERSVQAGQPAFAVFAPSQWLVLLAALAAASLALAVVLRLGQAVVRFVLGAAAPSASARPGWSVVTVAARRPRPLAGRFALRAPPLLLS
jgi:hypothetical protein